MSFIRSFVPKKLLQTSSDLTWKTVEIRKETDNFTATYVTLHSIKKTLEYNITDFIRHIMGPRITDGK